MSTEIIHSIDQSLSLQQEKAALQGQSPTRRFRGWSFAGVAGSMITFSLVIVAVFAQVIAPVNPWTSVSIPFQTPSLDHLFGTDDLGRDIFSGVVHGARTSIIVALSVAAISSTLGILLGCIAGFFGGILDDALMRFTEFFQIVPRFFLALVAIALFTPGLVTITLVLGLTSWSMTTRLLRAQILSMRERDFVLASRSLGGSPLHILWHHILPNTLAPVIVHTTLLIGQVMLIEAGLAFLGLGDPNHISWGYLLNNAQSFLRSAWWMPLFPGLALTLAVLGFNFIGDAINDQIIRRRS